MNILEKLKETAISVLPVMAIVLVLGIFVVHLDAVLLTRFVIGSFLLIAGLTIFLLGVDLGIQPLGERSGSELTKKRSLPLLLSVAFIIGFIVTAAEPDIQVFGDQVRKIFPMVNKTEITFVIAAGVGFFTMLGLFRTVLNFSLKLTFLISYTALFLIAIFAPNNFIGGATTGPMTVPFIMALGLGVSSARNDNKNSFGLTGVCSAGPIMAVLLYAIFLKFNGSLANSEAIGAAGAAHSAISSGGFLYKVFSSFGGAIGAVLHESLLSISPLFAMFILFQIFLIKMTAHQVTRIVIGFIYAFVGLAIFLIGVNGGFSQAGAALGHALGAKAITGGKFWYAILIGTGLALGAIIVCAEPAVWVLSEQVERVSGGTIKRKMLLIFLSVGTAIAIGLSMLRAVSGFDLKIILIPGYVISIILMIFCPSLFTGIAFDSGGVASGPLTSTFVLSFTLGAAASGNSGDDSFGVIALVAMMPLIAIQIMGIIFKFKQGGKK